MSFDAKCDVCQAKEASVFLTQIIGGKMQKVNLCPACAKAKGLNDPAGFQLAELLEGIGASQKLDPNPGALKCPVCGFTHTDLKKTARLGCSNCYRVFSVQLSEMLKNMHKGTVHKGKVPARHRLRQSRMLELQKLEADLAQAVQGEEYERAACLRDRIRSLAAAAELRGDHPSGT